MPLPSLEILHSHPAVHLLFPVINKRVNSLCLRNGVDRHTELLGFAASTLLRPFGYEGARVRPLYFGDAEHFFGDVFTAQIPMLQVQVQATTQSPIELVTYAVPAEAPMVIYAGYTLEIESWYDFVDAAIADQEQYNYYANILPNILYEMSDDTAIGALALEGASSTSVQDYELPLF